MGAWKVLHASYNWKQAPHLWLCYCSLKSPLFWLSLNTGFCVICLDMNGVALYMSFCVFLVLHCLLFFACDLACACTMLSIHMHCIY
jgi:hypothetical protein